MCGIAGALSITGGPVPALSSRLERMSDLLSHRGPDGKGIWLHHEQLLGFAHRRLSILDLTAKASQPMVSKFGAVISYNGEVYNHEALRTAWKSDWQFQSTSDTEVILAGLELHGVSSLNSLRGMFSFGFWNDRTRTFFGARDRFGIKPFYYAVAEGVFYFASEMKALLPFLETISIDYRSLEEYLAFQYTLGDKTLFEGIHELPPAHCLTISDGTIEITKYWEFDSNPDFSHSEDYFLEEIRRFTRRAVSENLGGDVEVGSYVSGGVDSTLIFLMANQVNPSVSKTFHGRVTEYPGFDESHFASEAVKPTGNTPQILDISSTDFEKSISKIIYHLDTPVAGPGALPQYLVSEMAAESVKVVLGGQGGDEIFGGYARYMIAYLEQCLAGAIDGTQTNNRFVVTLESIIPNLGLLKEYKPLIGKFWSSNLFGPPQQRYFDILNRSADFHGIVSNDLLNTPQLFSSFQKRFGSDNSSSKGSFLNSMLNFDFHHLLPALLQVEDRMSMAHGLESRVPLLDHELVEAVARIPPTVKFKAGESKRLLKLAFSDLLPEVISKRRDKMGFPVPLASWADDELSGFFKDTLGSLKAKNRDYLSSSGPGPAPVFDGQFSRTAWVLLSLELWQQQFHDRGKAWKF